MENDNDSYPMGSEPFKQCGKNLHKIQIIPKPLSEFLLRTLVELVLNNAL